MGVLECVFWLTLGLGTIFEAQDLKQNMRKVAIKVEKEDKSKKVL